MKDKPCAHIVAHGDVPMLQEFLGKGIRPLAAPSLCEIGELPQREVTRVDRDYINEASFRCGVAEFFDSFDLVGPQIHRDKISAVSSFWSRTRRRPGASCARA